MAAFSRRSLTSGYTLISRHRVLPSFSHLLPNSGDRDPSKSQPQSSPSSTSPFQNPRNNLGAFSLPLSLDPFHRSYSSSSSAMDDARSTDTGFIDDAATVLTDPAIVTATSAAAPLPFPGEVAAAAADSFPPVAALQHLIDIVHTYSGVNWLVFCCVSALVC